jgi:hypothetical protein
MASATQTRHQATAMPAAVRRGVVFFSTLIWCEAVLSSQPPSAALACVLSLTVALALWLMAVPGAASGQLCWQSPQWWWLDAQGRACAVQWVKVIDAGRLLCLRLSPSHDPQRSGWRWPRWVWLRCSDPVSWKKLRLALNGIDNV